MLVSVIVPTVSGREDYLARCLAAYEATSGNAELIVIRDRPTCGRAWEEGAAKAQGRYLHFTADDLVPRPGWIETAIETVDEGAIPAATVYDADGEFESCAGKLLLLDDRAPVDFSAVPFFSREQWGEIGPMGPMADSHYFTDNYLSMRASRAGIPILARTAYAFEHYWAQPGRGAGMTESERMRFDAITYETVLAAAKED